METLAQKLARLRNMVMIAYPEQLHPAGWKAAQELWDEVGEEAERHQPANIRAAKEQLLRDVIEAFEEATSESTVDPSLRLAGFINRLHNRLNGLCEEAEAEQGEQAENPIYPPHVHPITHTLKTWPEYFQAAIDHVKPFEVHRYDRDFQVGDTLHLQEWNPTTREYTGRQHSFAVTSVSVGGTAPFEGLRKGWCVIGTRDPTGAVRHDGTPFNADEMYCSGYNTGWAHANGDTMRKADLIVVDGKALKDRLGIWPTKGWAEIVYDFIEWMTAVFPLRYDFVTPLLKRLPGYFESRGVQDIRNAAQPDPPSTLAPGTNLFHDFPEQRPTSPDALNATTGNEPTTEMDGSPRVAVTGEPRVFNGHTLAEIKAMKWPLHEAFTAAALVEGIEDRSRTINALAGQAAEQRVRAVRAERERDEARAEALRATEIRDSALGERLEKAEAALVTTCQDTLGQVREAINACVNITSRGNRADLEVAIDGVLSRLEQAEARYGKAETALAAAHQDGMAELREAWNLRFGFDSIRPPRAGRAEPPQAPALPSPRYIRITQDNLSSVPKDAPIVHWTPKEGWQEYDGAVTSLGLMAYLLPQAEPSKPLPTVSSTVGILKVIPEEAHDAELDKARFVVRRDTLDEVGALLADAPSIESFDSALVKLQDEAERAVERALTPEPDLNYHHVTVTARGVYVTKEAHEAEVTASRDAALREAIEAIRPLRKRLPRPGNAYREGCRDGYTACIEAVEALIVQSAPTCAWIESFDGIWSGSCKIAWSFDNSVGPSGNAMRFCPGCGKPLVEECYAPELDEEDETQKEEPSCSTSSEPSSSSASGRASASQSGTSSAGTEHGRDPETTTATGQGCSDPPLPEPGFRLLPKGDRHLCKAGERRWHPRVPRWVETVEGGGANDEAWYAAPEHGQGPETTTTLDAPLPEPGFRLMSRGDRHVIEEGEHAKYEGSSTWYLCEFSAGYRAQDDTWYAAPEPTDWPTLPPNARRIQFTDAAREGDLIWDASGNWLPRAADIRPFDPSLIREGRYARPLPERWTPEDIGLVTQPEPLLTDCEGITEELAEGRAMRMDIGGSDLMTRQAVNDHADLIDTLAGDVSALRQALQQHDAAHEWHRAAGKLAIGSTGEKE